MIEAPVFTTNWRYIYKRLALKLIKQYQRGISPLFRAHCIYLPTCSEYAYKAIEKYGLLHGLWLAIKRISRCHPFHKGGFDPLT